MISTVLSSVRVGDALARRVRKSGRWGARYPAFEGSGFHVVTRGDAWLIVAGSEPIALAPGDVVLVPAGAEHGLSQDPRTLAELPVEILDRDHPEPGRADFEFICAAYRLGHGRVHRFLRALPQAVTLPRGGVHHERLRTVVGLFADDLDSEAATADVGRRALMDLVLSHALLWLQQEAAAPGWPPVPDPVVEAALRLIHHDPRRRTVEQLSAAAGLSRTAFSRRFAASVGTSPTTYMLHQRLAYGARLLRETPSSLAAIARAVGYSTEFAFSAAFRREYGISPGRFRER
ncbi:AraC family transcriptional regulator [Catenuloplanes japonicus]|uniref:AraC family transcriptional regulator n=1 Tax=Catenuloplanes japonicus TaxID=33876 RepID=UPI001E39F1E6|nr:AraC family transcriptional regulator [Catenuloplanes japonicus]